MNINVNRLNRIRPLVEQKLDNQENNKLDFNNIQQPDASRSLIFSNKNSDIAEPIDQANESNEEIEFKEGEHYYNIDYNRMQH